MAKVDLTGTNHGTK